MLNLDCNVKSLWELNQVLTVFWWTIQNAHPVKHIVNEMLNLFRVNLKKNSNSSVKMKKKN